MLVSAKCKLVTQRIVTKVCFPVKWLFVLQYYLERLIKNTYVFLFKVEMHTCFIIVHPKINLQVNADT